MSGFDDHVGMTGDDDAVLGQAAEHLRALVPDRPPMPSRELALMMADGIARPAGVVGRLRRLSARLAGLGMVAKITLAAGVAAAGVGGAATAVTFSESHDGGHHGSDIDRPGHHPASFSPTPSTSPTPRPTAHDGSPGTDDHGGATRSGEPESSASPSHDGESGDRGETSPAPTATASSGDGGGSHDGSGSDGGSSSPTPTSGSDGGSGSGSSGSDGSGTSGSGSTSGGGSDG